MNNIDFHHLLTLAVPAGHFNRCGLPMAGDGAAVKRAVAQLLDALGFDAVDTGSLSDSWRTEPNSPVCVAPYLGQSPPIGMDPGAAYAWLVGAPGAVVSAADVRQLISEGVTGGVVGGRLQGGAS